MENIKEKINITPDKTLFSKLGSTGYSIGEALAELVDNAIDARPKNNPVTITINVENKGKFITVEDNGNGMDKETATKSIVLGLSEKKEKLGQFGLGLKTAAMSLGKKFTIETTEKGSKEEYILVFDDDDFIKTGSWTDFEIEIKNGAEIDRSGTKITIERLRVPININLFTHIRKQLKERFSPFILNKEVKIIFNNKLIKAEKIILLPNTKENHIISLSNGEKIKMWTGILEIGSQEKSGFNMYRKGRLIRAHEKLAYSYHPSKMWITGEVHLDCIPVTHNKREFIITNSLYLEFLEKFTEKLKPILVKAQQRHREKRIQDLTQEVKETLKDNILKAISKVEDFKELAFPSTPAPEKRTKKGGDLFRKERREPRKDIVEIKEKKETNKEKGRKPRKTQIKKERFITIAGKKYRFDYEWQELEEEVPKISYSDKHKGFIMIILNSRFPALNIVKDQVFYIALYVTEGIIEEFFKENSRSFEKVIELRDKTIKKLAEIISESVEENVNAKISKIGEAKLKLLRKELENQTIENLSKRETELLKLRWGIGTTPHTLQEVGDKMKLTRERVRQIEEAAISKITD